jgi:SulP family sulfate permease
MQVPSVLKPKLLTTLRAYDRRQFIADLSAGVIVGVVALPLAIAFGIASGVSPEKGLITAVIAGFLISALGGSRVSIGGPTGAFVVIVAGIIEKYGIDGLTIATIMAGVLLVIMGLARLGSVIKFIPHPLIVGFTSGIALIIFSQQIRDLFGLHMTTVPSDFVEKWGAYSHSLASINPWAAAISVGSLVILIWWPRVSRKVPAPLVALLLTTVVVQVFHLPVETIATRFGAIPSSIPTPSIPSLDFATIKQLFVPASTIAMLAAIESLLCAVVADGMIGGRHRSNMELVAQGAANIVTPLFGGIPATGAIARTATSVRNGGRTPVAGIVHSIVLLLIMLSFGRWVALIPLSTLAAILVIVAYNMSEWRSFRFLLRGSRSDAIVLLVTFLLTVLVDLAVAIEVGMLLAVVLFMRRMAVITNVGIITRELTDDEPDADAMPRRDVPKDVHVFSINGPLFFGAAHKFEEAMIQIDARPRARVIDLSDVPTIDASGLHAIANVCETSRRQGVPLIISGIHRQPFTAFHQEHLEEKIGEENLVGTLDEALERIETRFSASASGSLD